MPRLPCAAQHHRTSSSIPLFSFIRSSVEEIQTWRHARRLDSNTYTHSMSDLFIYLLIYHIFICLYMYMQHNICLLDTSYTPLCYRHHVGIVSTNYPDARRESEPPGESRKPGPYQLRINLITSYSQKIIPRGWLFKILVKTAGPRNSGSHPRYQSVRLTSIITSRTTSM